jgi:aspartate/methionine/tyrosine aminotransferase
VANSSVIDTGTLVANSQFGDDSFLVTGAIYFWARLPEGCSDDKAVVAWLVTVHGVAVIPGSSCGAPGKSKDTSVVMTLCNGLLTV